MGAVSQEVKGVQVPAPLKKYTLPPRAGDNNAATKTLPCFPWSYPAGVIPTLMVWAVIGPDTSTCRQSPQESADARHATAILKVSAWADAPEPRLPSIFSGTSRPAPLVSEPPILIDSVLSSASLARVARTPATMILIGPVSEVDAAPSLNTKSGMFVVEGAGSATSVLLPMMVEVISALSLTR